MAKTAKLREKARDQERKGNWKDALALYEKVVQAEPDEDPDLTILNKIGDLRLRAGRIDGAVQAWERAAASYAESGLPNNAIALCRKVQRVAPDRIEVYRQLGQLSAANGFLADARENFLAYAERKQRLGDLDASFAALAEFADLFPDDTAIRRSLADQLMTHGREEEAVRQYRLLHEAALRKGDGATAEAVRQRLSELGVEEPAAPVVEAAPEGDEGEGAAGGGVLPGLEPTGMEVEELDDLEPLPLLDMEPQGDAGPAPPEAELAAGLDRPEATDHPGDELLDIAPLDGLEATTLEPAREPDAEADEEGDVLEDALLDIDAEPASGLEATGVREDLAADADADLEIHEASEAADEAIPAGDMQVEDFDLEAEPLPLLEPDVREADAGLDIEIGTPALPDPSDVLPADEVEETGNDREEPGVLEIDLEGVRIGTDAEGEDAAAYADHEATSTGEDEDEAGLEIEGDVEAEAEVEAEADAEPVPMDPVADGLAALAAEPADLEALESLLAAPAGARAAEVETAARAVPRALAEGGDHAAALRATGMLLERWPDDVRLLQKRAEYAFRAGDRRTLLTAYVALAARLEETGEPAKAAAVRQRVRDLDPDHPSLAAPSPPVGASGGDPAPATEEYVDLGQLILGGQPLRDSTRFVVPEEEPSGDEDRDFAEMLSQFKAKVSENIAVEDSASHFDLGLAFKDMGLIDEAIGQFQVALRGGANPLRTLEVLGQCFTEKGQFAVAVRVLERALNVRGATDGDLVGVLYQLACCEEALGREDAAREHFERVLAVDVGFRDVSARLAGLSIG
jgi:tetratricopeptide (TPR) repeat protein